MHPTFAANFHRLSDWIIPTQGREGTRKRQQLKPAHKPPPFLTRQSHGTATAPQPKVRSIKTKSKATSKGTWQWQEDREQLRAQHGAELHLAQVLQGYVAHWQDKTSGCFNLKVLAAIEEMKSFLWAAACKRFSPKDTKLSTPSPDHLQTREDVDSTTNTR